MSNSTQTGTWDLPYWTVAEVAAKEGVTPQRLRQRSLAGWRGFPPILSATPTLGLISMIAYDRWVAREEKAGNR